MIVCRWLSVGALSFEDITGRLDPETRARVYSCVRKRKAEEIALCSFMLASLVSQILDTNPTDVVIRHSQSGRPYCDSSKLFLTSSHCDGKCVAAVSDGRIGCDLQSLRPFPGEAVRAFFSEEDFDHIGRSPDPGIEMTRIWCIREALYKYLGDSQPDWGSYLKKVSAGSKDALEEEYGVRLIEGSLDGMMLAVVAERTEKTGFADISRFCYDEAIAVRNGR